jgi:hypothetical protein
VAEEQASDATADTFLISYEVAGEKYYAFCATVYSLKADALSREHLIGIERLFEATTFKAVALDCNTIDSLPVTLRSVSVSAQSGHGQSGFGP